MRILNLVLAVGLLLAACTIAAPTSVLNNAGEVIVDSEDHDQVEDSNVLVIINTGGDVEIITGEAEVLFDEIENWVDEDAVTGENLPVGFFVNPLREWIR